MQGIVSAISSLDDPATIATGVLLEQAQALAHAANTIGQEFTQAIDLILDCRGRVIIIGVGKSGLIGKKHIQLLRPSC